MAESNLNVNVVVLSNLTRLVVHFGGEKLDNYPNVEAQQKKKQHFCNESDARVATVQRENLHREG